MMGPLLASVALVLPAPDAHLMVCFRTKAGEVAHVQHFFLNILNGSTVLEDPDGQDFANLDGAIAEAAASARDLVAYGIMQNEDMSARSFLIRDGKDETVATVPFRDTLPGRLRGWPLPGSMDSYQPYVTANAN